MSNEVDQIQKALEQKTQEIIGPIEIAIKHFASTASPEVGKAFEKVMWMSIRDKAAGIVRSLQ